ncbi:MAG: hypothetical protein ACK5O2_08520 [Microthrixaceae bacterium]
MLSDGTDRDWLSFEHEGETYLFDLTFLTSNWHCIFGAGCKGVHEHDATEQGHGCCSHGAHFADKADRRRVTEAIGNLTDDQWQFKGLAGELDGAIFRNDDKDWVTRTHDGACIMLNREGFGRGVGCALHLAALDDGASYVGYKPEVCWQLPLRYTFHTDEVDHTTYTLRDWKRRDWGEGGADFHWWCTEGPEAFSGSGTVVESMRDEITELVGEAVYARLCEEIDRRRELGTPVPQPVRRTGGIGE